MYSALDYNVDTSRKERCREIAEMHLEESYFIRCKRKAKTLDNSLTVNKGNHIIFIDAGNYCFTYKPTTGKVTLLYHNMTPVLYKRFKDCRSPEDVVRCCYRASRGE